MMRFGALEIGIVIVIILIIFGVMRLKKMAVNPPPETEMPVRARRYREKPRQPHHPRLQLIGFITILMGIFVLLSSLNLLSLIKWVFWGPILALIIVALGLAAIFLARRG